MRWLVVLSSAALLGCAAAPPPAPTAPSSAPPPAAPEPPRAGPKPIAPAAVPPPPAECAALVAHPSTGCAPAGNVKSALALAFEAAGESERDAALACLEESSELPAGFVRALRAERADERCADALVVPLLENPARPLSREIEGTLLGLALAGRLSRLLADPPVLTPPFSKPSFEAFLKDKLQPWVVAQALAIGELSLQGSRLAGYGRGVAALAAGNADLRFVDAVREVPLPEEIRAVPELSEAYYAALDQALEPRKQRGRDAALVGLRTFADIGVVRDARVTRARELISKLWAGSRVDALDQVLLPDLPAVTTKMPEAALARQLPTSYATLLLAGAETDAALLHAFPRDGIPKVLRESDPTKLPPPVQLGLAYGLVQSGLRYFRAADFRRAREVLGQARPDPTGRLLGALCQALERGPEDIADLMVRGTGVRGAFDVSALDAIARERGLYAGLAAFDAAYLLGLAPRQDDPAFWDELAARFEAAEKLLRPAARQKKETADRPQKAREYAEAAKATAAALRAKH